MRKVLFFLFTCVSLGVYCQDVLVTNEGESLKVYNLEIGPSTIFYQLSDASNAEIKRIAKSDVLIIRKADGTKIDPNANEAVQTTHVVGNTSSAEHNNQSVLGLNNTMDYTSLSKENLPLVHEYNSHDVVYLNTDTDKKAGAIICTLGIKDGSIIETPELKVSFSMKKKYMTYTFSSGRIKNSRIAEITDNMKSSEDSYLDMMVVSLRNKTNKTIYIDLGTSYFITGEESTPYYIPTATTTSSGNTSGGSVNMGSVAGALGIGGALGTLAGGVNIGGSSGTSTSTTTYSQRVISIPPMASVSLDPQSIGRGHLFEAVGRHRFFRNIEMSCYDYFMSKGNIKKKKECDEIRFEDLKRGEKIDIPQMKDVTPLSVYITYSYDEMITQTQNMRIDFYWRQILGVKLWTTDIWSTIDYRKCPLIFFSGNPIQVNIR